jgi:FtsZ-binding cell division protein ZapB
MSKKQQTKLEKVTAERDNWRRLAQERAETINSLRLELERISMFAKAFTGGAMNDLNQSIEAIQRECEQLKRQRDEALESFQKLFASLPHDVIEPNLSPVSIEHIQETGNSLIGVAVFGRDDSSTDVDIIRSPAFAWHGDKRSAVQSVFALIGSALVRIPLPSDIGKQSLDGLSHDDIQALFEILTHYHDLEPDKYNETRLEQFKCYWPKMQSSGFYESRSVAQTRFNAFLKRTFENRDLRRNQLNIEIIYGN